MNKKNEEIMDKVRDWVANNSSNISERQKRFINLIIYRSAIKNYVAQERIYKAILSDSEIVIDMTIEEIPSVNVVYLDEYLDTHPLIKPNAKRKTTSKNPVISNVKSIIKGLGYADSTINATIKKFGEGLDQSSETYMIDLIANIGKSRSKYAKNARLYLDSNI